ncbi:hypothetical protein [Shewanella algae]|uniref:hypothetical protein n=1 Tax=Shewanella algae TaxID=38313 RepID=UPI001BEEB16C|nr:hypothetical protein [Shewanella algae]BCV51379.1 hypothetical protein TUM17382_40720 [Shewanella algae]
MSPEPMIFSAACIKTLSAVEVHPSRSNQHEFNGVSALKKIFGLERFERNALFSIRGSGIEVIASVTWYDSRKSHPRRSEHRLYFQTNEVMSHAKEGDNILIGIDDNQQLHIILIPNDLDRHERWTAVQY